MRHRDPWYERLRLEIARSGEKQATVARRAGIAPETLNRIINGHGRPGFETVVRIARAAGVRVGWLLDEPGYTFSVEQRKRLREAAAIIIEATT